MRKFLALSFISIVALVIGTPSFAQSRSRKSAQDAKWSFCLTAGTLLPANQERP